MKNRISLRWRLILISWSLALLTAVALTLILHARTRRQLLSQIEKTLETKCDEVITVLKSADSHPMLEDFLFIETNYRSSPYTYFYEIRDTEGHILARSATLSEVHLPIPPEWKAGASARPVLVQTESHPSVNEEGQILLRSERVEVPVLGRPVMLVIQTAVSLAPFERAVGQTLREALLLAACGLCPVFILLWFVTTHSLRPVARMTSKAAQITPTNLVDRLPIAGTGDELDELARVLNDMLDRLGRSLRQMEQFSSGAAHQLRTPLTRMRGELELLLRTDVSDPPRSELERIQEELERLSRLCGRLLLLARLDRRAVDTSLLNEQVQLDEVVAELVEQTAPYAKERGVSLRRGRCSAGQVRGSRALLVEALLNLLDNAVRATPSGGSVTVSLAEDESVVRLSVEDDGPGIPPEERERIFEPFYRIQGTSAEPHDGGSGLGLAIVRGIAQAHGGSVDLADVTSGGCSFTIVLPARSAP